MISIGLVGMNEGNGHPYSYSAMFNGFNERFLAEECEFDLIKKYLPRDHKNKSLIREAKVTHIWTQNKKVSERISRVSLIDNISHSYEDLLNSVDAVIIARDDVCNHLKFIEPAIEKNLPIFIDKQIVKNKNELSKVIRMMGNNYPFLAGSPIRFNRKLKAMKKTVRLKDIKFVQGTCKSNWLRYGHHLLEGIVQVLGPKPDYVRHINQNKDSELLHIFYPNGVSVVLYFSENLSLPIESRFYFENKSPKFFYFDDYAYSIKKMMKEFTKVCMTREPPSYVNEIYEIAQIIIAGEISKEKGGVKISPKSLSSYK